MKRTTKLNSVLAALALGAALAACDSAPKGDNATITDEQKTGEASGQSYVVDTTDSWVKFTGYGVGKNHPGKFNVASGNVNISNNQITGGEFIINIRSLDLEQKDAMFQEKLRPHLLSGDFFDAEKFGTAKFEITGAEPYKSDGKDTSIVDGANLNISGNLTLKGETKNITFPAKVDLDDNEVKGKANFNIDRTQWKMNYGSDKTLGDKFISESVNVKLDIKAKRQ